MSKEERIIYKIEFEDYADVAKLIIACDLLVDLYTELSKNAMLRSYDDDAIRYKAEVENCERIKKILKGAKYDINKI